MSKLNFESWFSNFHDKLIKNKIKNIVLQNIGTHVVNIKVETDDLYLHDNLLHDNLKEEIEKYEAKNKVSIFDY